MRSPNKPHICSRRFDDGVGLRSPGYIVHGRFYPFSAFATVRHALRQAHKEGSNGSTFYECEPFIAEHGADHDRSH